MRIIVTGRTHLLLHFQILHAMIHRPVRFQSLQLGCEVEVKGNYGCHSVNDEMRALDSERVGDAHDTTAGHGEGRVRAWATA